MATRTEVIMIDDLDGTDIAGTGKTVTFAHAGTNYEIDLSERNARQLSEALAPYVAAARRVNHRRGEDDPVDLHIIRIWAKEHDIKVSERGRVSQEVVEAYRAAHKPNRSRSSRS